MKQKNSLIRSSDRSGSLLTAQNCFRIFLSLYIHRQLLPPAIASCNHMIISIRTDAKNVNTSLSYQKIQGTILFILFFLDIKYCF